jgi:hypothetical protein
MERLIWLCDAFYRKTLTVEEFRSQLTDLVDRFTQDELYELSFCLNSEECRRVDN